jgi:hypothetical protein
MAISGQRLGKHFPVATDESNDRIAVFSIWSVLRCYKQGTRLELSSVRESVKRGLEPEAQTVLEPLPGNI